MEPRANGNEGWRLRAVAAILTILTLAAALGAGPAAVPLHAQVTLLEPPAVPAANVDDSFLTLTASGCAVRYRSGALDRAHHVLMRLELVTRQLNGWSEVPVPLAVYLLDRRSWSEVGLQSAYGVPVRTGPTAVALPAEGDAGTVELWRAVLETGAVPLVPGVPIQGTAEEAGTLAIADVLLQIEAARGFVQRAGLLGDRAWIGEVASHTAALALFQRNERSRVPEIAGFFDRLRETTGREGAFSLAGYSPSSGFRDDAELRRWLWYQATFFEAALALVERHGHRAIPRLQKLAGERRVLREAELLAEFPELRPWHQRVGDAAP
jgi:hypothetical protein